MGVFVFMSPVIAYTMLRIWDPRKARSLPDRIAWTVTAASILAMIFVAIHAIVSESDGAFRSRPTIRLHRDLFLGFAALAVIGPSILLLRRKTMPANARPDDADPTAGAPRHVGHITPESLKSRMASGESLALLDVREVFERDLATIPPGGAAELAIPMGEIPARMDEVVQIAVDRPVVVYCHHGQRSMVVAKWLAARGVGGLLNLEGGIDAWSRADPSTPRY